ncbi:hypothetical protein SEA_WELCOME_62 [Microbacterium phage Welcome]|nr:hypothetical protein SEA_WELCOME_62 [Microbacterium phage Welcome]
MPITPGGRWSPADSDDWDLTTDLAAMQVSNEAASTAEITAASRYRTMTNAQRVALPAGQLTEGLRVFTTDTRLNHIYTQGAWVSETNWATLTLGNGFTHAQFPLQWRRTLDRVVLRGGVYRATQPVTQTGVSSIPAIAPAPISRVYAWGRPDFNHRIEIQNDRLITSSASGALTTGIGFTFDGVGYDL